MNTIVTENYVQINNNLLCYSITGRDSFPPLVLIHTLGLNKSMWNEQIEFLSKDYQVVSYDIRGHGSSGVSDGLYNIDLFVDDLIALMDHLKIQKVILCGISMGGYIAIRAVELFPERIQGLILCDTKSYADSNKEKIKRFEFIKNVKAKGEEFFSDNILEGLLSIESNDNHKDILIKTRENLESNSLLGICGTMLALASRMDSSESLKNIKIPTLILAGEKDNDSPPVDSQYLNYFITGSQLHIIKHAFYLSNLENPNEFNRLIKAFLTKNFNQIIISNPIEILMEKLSKTANE
ncbi:MAG: alpha/beta fold hydrolase [Bacteroidetes bacterium]|nr:alpha/beta fold hydrolase [Bacteroidota bacterium]HET6244320.1 alpha/beta fold hydrolase [Bacteroidia bacterium]